MTTLMIYNLGNNISLSNLVMILEIYGPLLGVHLMNNIWYVDYQYKFDAMLCTANLDGKYVSGQKVTIVTQTPPMRF